MAIKDFVFLLGVLLIGLGIVSDSWKTSMIGCGISLFTVWPLDNN